MKTIDELYQYYMNKLGEYGENNHLSPMDVELKAFADTVEAICQEQRVECAAAVNREYYLTEAEEAEFVLTLSKTLLKHILKTILSAGKE